MADKPIDTQLAAANDPRIVEGSEGYLIEVDGEIVPNYDATITIFSEGDIVTGKVVRIDKDEVLVDIGYKSEGVIPVNELSIRKIVNTSDEVALGEEIDALVMHQGRRRRAPHPLQEARPLREGLEAHRGAPSRAASRSTARVIEVVKGGLILDLGVRGFLPASLVDIRRVQDLDEYVGQELNCRVIEMNRNRNNVVLSPPRRARGGAQGGAPADHRRAQRGRRRRGHRSRNIVDFGAFVDLDGIDGLIHISRALLDAHQPPVRGAAGQPEGQGQGARHRPRPPAHLASASSRPRKTRGRRSSPSTSVGDVVEGRVTKIVAFGAFVEIYEGIEGLVHICELANRHVERPDEVVSVGPAGQRQDHRDRLRAPPPEPQHQARRRRQRQAAAPARSRGSTEADEAEEAVEAEELRGRGRRAVAEAVETVEEAEEISSRPRPPSRRPRPSDGRARPAETPEELGEAIEDAAVVEAAAEVVEAAAEEFVAEHEPELGLSDDVFPAGRPGAADEAEASPATRRPEA